MDLTYVSPCLRVVMMMMMMIMMMMMMSAIFPERQMTENWWWWWWWSSTGIRLCDAMRPSSKLMLSLSDVRQAVFMSTGTTTETMCLFYSCIHRMDGLVQESRNSIASALELRLPCTTPIDVACPTFNKHHGCTFQVHTNLVILPSVEVQGSVDPIILTLHNEGPGTGPPLLSAIIAPESSVVLTEDLREQTLQVTIPFCDVLHCISTRRKWNVPRENEYSMRKYHISLMFLCACVTKRAPVVWWLGARALTRG